MPAITLHTVEEIGGALPEQTDLEVGRFRDEFQVQVDHDVEDLKFETAEAGWPDADPSKFYTFYIVGKDDLSALKSVIRRACTLYKVEPDFYKNAPTEAGHVVVKFHVSRKLDKDNKPVKDDSLNSETGKPTADAKKAHAKAVAERKAEAAK